MEQQTNKIRIDKYLWAIRIFKTRSLAADACAKGHVKWLGNPVKASKQVLLNETYEIKTEARKWLIQVSGIIENRVAYPEAIKNYLDLTPEEERKPVVLPSAFIFNTGKRQSKQGRPTKKNRRDLDEYNESN